MENHIMLPFSRVENIVERLLFEKETLKEKNLELQNDILDLTGKLRQLRHENDLEIMYDFYLREEIHKVLIDEVV